MGNYTNAYATVKPVDNKMVNFANEQEQLNRAHTIEQKGIKEEQEKKEQARIEKFANYKSKLTPYDSGSATLNTSIANALAEAQDKLLEQYKIANDPKRTDVERMQAQANIEDLSNYPDYLKNVTDRFTEINKVYVDKKNKGEWFQNDEWENLFKDGFKGMTVKMNEQFRPDTVFFDLDGDGKPDNIKDVIKFDQITNMIPDSIGMPKVDIETLAYKIGKDLGKTTTNSINGYNETKTTEVTFDTAFKAVESLVTDENIRSYLRLKNEDYKQEITPELRQKIKENLARIELSNTDYSRETKYNYADENADLSRAQSQRNADRNYGLNREKLDFAKSKAKKDDKTPKISGSSTPTVNTWGSDFMKKIDTNTAKAVNISGGGVKINAIPYTIGDKHGTLSNVTVENYVYDRNGNLILDVSYNEVPKGKEGPAQNKKTRITASKETELRLANGLGISVEELRAKSKNDTRQKIDY